jgi:hypothetical protein
MSQPADEPQGKKIIVDEDWKSQVQAEKEAAQKAARETAATETPGRPKGPLPPPSLTFLTSSLGMQAMIAMGILPNPVDNKLVADLEQAKHLVDTIEMLREKTEGNRSPDETAAIDDLLHELRLAYVTVKEQPRAESGQGASSKLEL